MISLAENPAGVQADNVPTLCPRLNLWGPSQPMTSPKRGGAGDGDWSGGLLELSSSPSSKPCFHFTNGGFHTPVCTLD